MEPRPPRVLFLASGRGFGGVERWCLDTASALCRRDLEVLLACPPASQLEARASGADLPTVVFDTEAGWFPLAAVRLARLLARREVDLVLANTDREVAVAALACALTGRALIERRGRSEAPAVGFVHRWLHRNFVRRVVANCRAVVDRLASSAPFVPEEKVVLIENGVAPVRLATLDRGAARAELGLEEGELAVGFLGPLAMRKGLENLLVAWRQVVESEPRARLLIAGSGELEHVLDRHLGDAALAATVRRVGFVREPLPFLAALDLFVLASVRDEGASHALLEAMSAGLAAVVTNCGGSPELVESGRTGRVAPKNHPDSLAAAILDLLGDERLRGEMGERARVAAARHDPERIGDEWEALLREVLGPDPVELSRVAAG